MTDSTAREFEAEELRALRHDVSALKIVNRLRYASLPIAVLLAGFAAATTAPIIFAVGAGVSAVVIVLSELYARRVRVDLDERLRDLAARNVLHPDEVKKIFSTANTATVPGSST
jgi:tRNA1(Val) A37 N6-methylase TrmN6